MAGQRPRAVTKISDLPRRLVVAVIWDSAFQIEGHRAKQGLVSNSFLFEELWALRRPGLFMERRRFTCECC